MSWRWEAFRAPMLMMILACFGAAAHGAPDPIAEAVQRALLEKGFDPGEVDGAIGTRTRRAIEAFQRSIGLPETGWAGVETLKALGLEPSLDALATRDAEALQGEAPAGERAIVDDAAPERDPSRVLSFARLGWHRPQTGEEALERLRAMDAPPVLARGTGSLMVPESEFVFVLGAGEEVPGLACDPASARLAIELVFGPDGPVLFTPVSDGEYCQMGIGIALGVGATLEMRRVDWGDVQYPRGTVRVTNQGLEYAR